LASNVPPKGATVVGVGVKTSKILWAGPERAEKRPGAPRRQGCLAPRYHNARSPNPAIKMLIYEGGTIYAAPCANWYALCPAMVDNRGVATGESLLESDRIGSEQSVVS
jgi:hypothetical protein